MHTPGNNIDAWRPCRIGIVGAGAMGMSLTAIVADAAPTMLVERDSGRAAAIFEHGARTIGLLRASSHPIVVSNIGELAKVGGVSVLFVATKTTAIPTVAEELRPILAEITDQPQGIFVVSFQNGIEPGSQLVELLRYDRVLRMVINMGATVRPTGEVEVLLNSPPHYIGAPDGLWAEECASIASMLTESGFETIADGQIERHVWEKGIVNAAVNPVAALVNSNIGEVMHAPARSIVEALLHEGLTVARAEGLDLGEDFAARTFDTLARWGAHTPSMVEDIRNGRESEIRQLNRQIMRHAQRLGIAAPTHAIIDALIETFDWKIYDSDRAPNRRDEKTGEPRVSPAS